MRKIWLWLIVVLIGSQFNCQSKSGPQLRVAHIHDPLAGASGRANMDWLQQTAKQFETQNPGLAVTFEQIQWDQIDSKIMADFRAGIPHDVVWTSPQLMPKHFLTGDLYDLNLLLKESPLEISDFAWNPVWDNAARAGRRLALPLGVHTRAVAYRRDWFQAAGLDADAPPTDLSQLIAIAKKLTRDTDGDGKTDIWGLGMYLGPYRATIEIAFAPLIWHFGGELWDDSTRQAVFASAAGVQAAQFIYDLIYRHQVTPLWVISGTYDDVIFRNFMNGKLAMAWGWGSYWIQALEENGWINGLFPPTANGKATIADIFVTPTRNGAQFTNSWTISIYQASYAPQQSLAFIQAVLQPENLLRYPDAGLPARSSLWNRAEYQTAFYQKWFQCAQRGRPMPFTANYMELADVVAAALQEILVNQAPIQATLTKFQTEYNQRFGGI